MVRPGDQIADKYRVDSVIGRGGMGLVVAATHLGLEQQVAIKFLRGDVCASATALTRFMREARATTRLESDNVARVLDLGMHEGAPFMVLELLKGRTLAQELAARGQLPASVASEYVLQACDALGEAHSIGLVHRDLKPGNIFLVRRRGGHVQVKVLDFGVSKMIYGGATRGEPSLTDMRSILGTPLYVSPEQLRNARGVDARTDVWALGVILYELIAGRPPFSAPSIRKLFVKIAHEPPPPLRTAQAGFTPELERLVLRCLDKDPAARFANAAELGLELAGFAALAPDRLDRFVSFAGKASRSEPPPPSSDGWLEQAGLQTKAPPHVTTSTTHVDRRWRNRAWRRRLTIAGLGVLGAGAVAGASMTARRSLDAARVSAPVPTPATAPSPPGSEPDGSIELVIGASPAGALLYLDGRLLRGNPYVGELSRGAHLHVVRAEASGHLPEERRFTAEADTSVSISLRALPASP